MEAIRPTFWIPHRLQIVTPLTLYTILSVSYSIVPYTGVHVNKAHLPCTIFCLYVFITLRMEETSQVFFSLSYLLLYFKVRVYFHTTETVLLPCKTFTSLKGEITSLKFQPWPWYHLYKEGMCICFSNITFCGRTGTVEKKRKNGTKKSTM